MNGITACPFWNVVWWSNSRALPSMSGRGGLGYSQKSSLGASVRGFAVESLQCDKCRTPYTDLDPWDVSREEG